MVSLQVGDVLQKTNTSSIPRVILDGRAPRCPQVLKFICSVIFFFLQNKFFSFNSNCSNCQVKVIFTPVLFQTRSETELFIYD